MPRMGLINRILGTRDKGSRESGFPDSTPPNAVDDTPNRNARRRDLVRISLRETMRQHGIPSDWMDCRTLSVLTRKHRHGMHVQFLVRKADEQLLPYVHAFQESFWREVQRTDPRAKDWLFSVGWEFYGQGVKGFAPMPDPRSWRDAPETTAPAELDAMDTQPAEYTDEDVASDLQALQAVMSAPVDLADLPDAAPRAHKPVR